MVVTVGVLASQSFKFALRESLFDLLRRYSTTPRESGEITPQQFDFTLQATSDSDEEDAEAEVPIALREELLGALERNASRTHVQALFSKLKTRAARRSLANTLRVSGDAKSSALFLACVNRSPGVVAVLVNEDVIVTAGRLDEGTTPLHVAAGWLHSDAVVEELLAHRDIKGVAASLRAKPDTGGLRAHTPLWWAVFYGHPATRDRLDRWMRKAGWAWDQATDTFEQIESEASPAANAADRQSSGTASQPLPPRQRLLSAAEVIAELQDWQLDDGEASQTPDVSLAEILPAMRLGGASPTEAEGAEYREALRRLGVTSITPAILEGLLSEHVRAHPPGKERVEMEEAWSVVDSDGDGVVSGVEMDSLREMLTTMGEPLSKEELEEFLLAIDKDRSGSISRAEFDEMMMT